MGDGRLAPNEGSLRPGPEVWRGSRGAQGQNSGMTRILHRLLGLEEGRACLESGLGDGDHQVRERGGAEDEGKKEKREEGQG